MAEADSQGIPAGLGPQTGVVCPSGSTLLGGGAWALVVEPGGKVTSSGDLYLVESRPWTFANLPDQASGWVAQVGVLEDLAPGFVARVRVYAMCTA